MSSFRIRQQIRNYVIGGSSISSGGSGSDLNIIDTSANDGTKYYINFTDGSGNRPLYINSSDLTYRNRNLGINIIDPMVTLDVSGQTTIRTPLVKIGVNAGVTGQGIRAIAIGERAGEVSQGLQSIAIGSESGCNAQASEAVAIGIRAGQTSQQIYSVALGFQSGGFVQGQHSVAIGLNAGRLVQCNSAISIGDSAGEVSQGTFSIAIGCNAGRTGQRQDAIAIGTNAGSLDQGLNAIAIGNGAGISAQRIESISIGNNAGNCNQGTFSIGIGFNAGANFQDASSIAIGSSAGVSNQGFQCVAIGANAGRTNQRGNAIAIGTDSGFTSQGTQSIAIGINSGKLRQGSNCIAIGAFAGVTDQSQNTIIINASGTDLDSDISNALFIKPISPSLDVSRVLIYNPTSGRVSYNTTKTFVIDHPIDENKYLVHACLEGPEAGVYYRGKSEITNDESIEICLPNYTSKFYDFTVQVTPITSTGAYRVSEVVDGKFKIIGSNGKFFWLVHGSRQYITVEPNKSDIIVKGDGPYKYI